MEKYPQIRTAHQYRRRKKLAERSRQRVAVSKDMKSNMPPNLVLLVNSKLKERKKSKRSKKEKGI